MELDSKSMYILNGGGGSELERLDFGQKAALEVSAFFFLALTLGQDAHDGSIY